MLHKVAFAVFFAVWVIPAIWNGNLGTGWMMWYVIVGFGMQVISKSAAVLVLILEDFGPDFKHTHASYCNICEKRMKS